MLDRFTAYNQQQHLLPTGREVLLAVSGGRDSVAMAHLCHRAGVHFAVAHYNFGLRPGDCDHDEAFVARLAKEYGARLHVERHDTRAYAADHHLGIEEAARELRYRFFSRLCREHGYPCVATAHHRDDSIETFFLNLFRGTGIEGLHGIKSEAEVEGVRVVRPLLCFSRAEIDGYVSEHNLPYVEDHTNSEFCARRNRLRLQLMPLLRELYPSVDTTMEGNLRRLGEAGEVYRMYIEGLRAQLVQDYPSMLATPHPMLTGIRTADLEKLEPRRTLLFELLRGFGANAAMVDDLSEALPRGSGPLFLTPSHRLTLHRDWLLAAPRQDISMPQIEMSEATLPDRPDRSGREVYIDADKLQGRLRLRLWKRGDKFQPFGMKGSRLVSDFLTEQGLCRLEKEWVWLLEEEGGRVVWVVGLRADERFRVTNLTKRVMKISLAVPESV